MSSFLIRRIIQTLFVILIITFICFSLMHVIPGDPAVTMLGVEASPEQVEALQQDLWLDRPFMVQYGHWLLNAIQGDFGYSLHYREDVIDTLARRIPVTVFLSSIALVLSVILGIGAGIICAIRRGGVLDQTISVLSNIGLAIPIFWLGILGIYLFGLKLELIPIQNWTTPSEDFGNSLLQSIIPIVLLAIPAVAVIARQTRSSMLEVIRQDYIRTAISKGLRERVVILKHALKNGLIPVVTLLGIHIRVLVGGSVLVESVFNIPGMGRLLVISALNKDFLVVQAGVLLIGAVVCLVNLLVDISYGWLDPRIKYE